ncbi:MAG: zf-HC2 domain-containing protein, partial [Pseudomonadota bacterium]
MNAHIVELDTSPHQRVQKLLPWAATGRLPETEARLVDEHVAGCAECQRDLAWERKVQAVQPAAGASPDMEAALARLLPQLEERPAAKPAGRTAANWMRWAMAAQLLLIAGLGTQLVRQHDAYRLLGVSGS